MWNMDRRSSYKIKRSHRRLCIWFQWRRDHIAYGFNGGGPIFTSGFNGGTIFAFGVNGETIFASRFNGGRTIFACGSNGGGTIFHSFRRSNLPLQSNHFPFPLLNCFTTITILCGFTMGTLRVV